MHQNTVDFRVGVEFTDSSQQFGLRSGFGQHLDSRRQPELRRGAVFAAHIGDARRVVTDAHHHQLRAKRKRLQRPSEFAGNARRHLFTVQTYRRHANAPPRHGLAP